MTSRRLSSDNDFDDVIVAHRSRDSTERRSRLYRRPGNSMAAGALFAHTRTCLATVVISTLLVTIESLSDRLVHV